MIKIKNKKITAEKFIWCVISVIQVIGLITFLKA